MQHTTEAANDGRRGAIPAAEPGAQGDKAELFFGFVGPMGVDLDLVCAALAEQLRVVGYEAHLVGLGELVGPFTGKPAAFTSEYERIAGMASDSLRLRRDAAQPDVLGRLGIGAIRDLRARTTGNRDLPVMSGAAFLVQAFTRPEEVALYREVYGSAFTLVSIYSPRQLRIRELSCRLQSVETDGDAAEQLAKQLVALDQLDEEAFGHRVGDAFVLADYFVTTTDMDGLKSSLERLVSLTFADPFIAPTRDEQGMFLAQAVALRSLDLSRQVGAVIASADGDVIATGCNEVPKPGGGFYWTGDPGARRDVEVGHDSNVRARAELVTDAIARLRANGWLAPQVSSRSPESLAREALLGRDAILRRSRISDVIEFGRAVHAEMAAITQAAKEGRPLQGAKLFCTTFPCHLCAKHIVASGIEEVLFIEPYDKSRAAQLHSDAISVESPEPSSKRTNFRAFVGVAPRRYMEYFSLGSAKRKTPDGRAIPKPMRKLAPRIRASAMAYPLAEKLVLGPLVTDPDSQDFPSTTKAA